MQQTVFCCLLSPANTPPRPPVGAQSVLVITLYHDFEHMAQQGTAANLHQRKRQPPSPGIRSHECPGTYLMLQPETPTTAAGEVFSGGMTMFFLASPFGGGYLSSLSLLRVSSDLRSTAVSCTCRLSHHPSTHALLRICSNRKRIPCFPPGKEDNPDIPNSSRKSIPIVLRGASVCLQYGNTVSGFRAMCSSIAPFIFFPHLSHFPNFRT